MPHNNLDTLLKTDDGSTVSLEKSKKYSNTKRKINGICKALSKEKGEYDPARTVESIERYVEYKDKIDRILYSEISSYIFALDMNARGVFATNIENLMLYALNLEEKNINDDCRKIIIKIYDHSQLALNQIENVKNILGAGIEETRMDLRSEIKGIEKEYISILGIFASIVLAFVGGITFSSSVLQNIGKVSIYRLLLVIVILALVLVNVIWMLIKFIAQINDKDIKIFPIRVFNCICLLISLMIVVSWMLNVQEIAGFISKRLPWCK
ncbi:hypothetical protein NE634_07895 [Lacrimispora saccharolytica]|nr:hypothetical protein [Lacrimispora saccharolytica]